MKFFDNTLNRPQIVFQNYLEQKLEENHAPWRVGKFEGGPAVLDSEGHPVAICQNQAEAESVLCLANSLSDDNEEILS